MNEIQVFSFEQHQIRTSAIDSQIWWHLTDVCKALCLSNTRSIADRLEEDERCKLNLHRQGKAWFINESGLYSVILRSDKPNAKPFRKWVTSEVLPSIRRTGNYNIRPPMESPKVSDIKNYFILETGLSEHILGSKEVILDSAIRIIDRCCRDNEFSNIRTAKTSKGTAYCVDDLMMQMFKAIPHYIKNLTIKNNEKRMPKDAISQKIS